MTGYKSLNIIMKKIWVMYVGFVGITKPLLLFPSGCISNDNSEWQKGTKLGVACFRTITRSGMFPYHHDTHFRTIKHTSKSDYKLYKWVGIGIVIHRHYHNSIHGHEPSEHAPPPPPPQAQAKQQKLNYGAELQQQMAEAEERKRRDKAERMGLPMGGPPGAQAGWGIERGGRGGAGAQAG